MNSWQHYRRLLLSMTLEDHLAGNPAIAGVTADSRRVVPGSLFIALPGVHTDGHAFIPAALAAGAVAVIYTRPETALPPDVSGLRVPENRIREALALTVREFYHRPDEALQLAGITGTNGKTTSAYLIEDLLRRSGRRGGLISTVEYRTPETVWPANRTTPGPEEFFPLLARVATEGGEFAAMELSSHALDQHRTDGVRFQAAVFTNLTGDHLDYHKTMEAYFAAKKRLFRELLAPEGTAVLNLDDPFGAVLAAELDGRKIVTFGKNPAADFRLTDVRLSAAGSDFIIRRSEREYRLHTPLCGEHNLHNLLGALLAAAALGGDWDALLALLPETRPVPGRLEPLRLPSGATVFIDYAHTDDALKQVLTTLRPLTDGRLTTVFGCGGDRDRTKRPRMGRVAAEYADRLIVTSDNPRTETPEAIIADIRAGIPAETDCRIEPDRAQAIALACREAGPGDVVLIAGKGHETYQEINGVRHPFSDREEVCRFRR